MVYFGRIAIVYYLTLFTNSYQFTTAIYFLNVDPVLDCLLCLKNTQMLSIKSQIVHSSSDKTLHFIIYR